MPLYVSISGMRDRYGEDAITLFSDRANDSEADVEALNAAIADAEGEVNSYLGAVYDLPIVDDVASPESNPAVPASLRRVACDVAVYRVATDYGGALTTEKRQRYEDAIAWLKMVAEGKIVLGVATEPAADGGTATIHAAPRLFTRDKLRGF